MTTTMTFIFSIRSKIQGLPEVLQELVGDFVSFLGSSLGKTVLEQYLEEKHPSVSF